MSQDYVAMPEDFEDPRFAEHNQALFDEFIDLVIQGHDMRASFALVFGMEVATDNYTGQRILCTQRNPYYKMRYKKRMEEMPLKELWSVKSSIHNLVKLVRDPEVAASAKLNAIRELNIIYGITMIDENGNSKMGRSMDDFYKDFGEAAKEGEQFSRH